MSAAAPGFFSKSLALVSKDLRVEWRGRDTLPPMIAFAVTVALLLAFAVPETTPLDRAVESPVGAVALADVIAAFLWITVLFAGLIGFARTFEVEREDGAIESILLSPLDLSGVFAAKALANLAFLVIVEMVLVPVLALMFAIHIGGDWVAFALVTALVDVGFVAIGTLFASLAAQTRSRELILPILALPVLVPVFIAAFELSSDLFSGRGLEAVAARGWFGILIAYDVVFATVAALTFEFVIDA
jgi:heme exporter protein B